jgi:hypothetical protein
MVFGSHIGVLVVDLHVNDRLLKGRMGLKLCRLGSSIDILNGDSVILYYLFIKSPGGEQSSVLLRDELSELAYPIIVFPF